jgi:hypothetical protein
LEEKKANKEKVTKKKLTKKPCLATPINTRVSKGIDF